MDKWLTYNQVSLIPTQVSTVEHRAEVDTSVQFGPIKLGLPLIAAPMPDVSNGDMARKLRELGTFGWVHRFQSLEEQKTEYVKGYQTESDPYVGVAVGLNDIYRVDIFYKFGARTFCIDTANGANKMVERAVKAIKQKYPDVFLIVGNVASVENFQRLEEWGADAIRVGIAGGSVCETRTETGVYSPMASVVKECNGPWVPNGTPEWKAKYRRDRKALLIADGGIRTPADMCKALALGADLVMAGGIFAGTKESPGEVLKIDGKLFKILRGAASYSVQKGNSGYVEGAETIVPYQGSVEKVVNRFAAGLRSSMSYMNAKNLFEYKSNAKIVEVG